MKISFGPTASPTIVDQFVDLVTLIEETVQESRTSSDGVYVHGLLEEARSSARKIMHALVDDSLRNLDVLDPDWSQDLARELQNGG